MTEDVAPMTQPPMIASGRLVRPARDPGTRVAIAQRPRVFGPVTSVSNGLSVDMEHRTAAFLPAALGPGAMPGRHPGRPRALEHMA